MCCSCLLFVANCLLTICTLLTTHYMLLMIVHVAHCSLCVGHVYKLLTADHEWHVMLRYSVFMYMYVVLMYVLVCFMLYTDH